MHPLSLALSLSHSRATSLSLLSSLLFSSLLFSSLLFSLSLYLPLYISLSPLSLSMSICMYVTQAHSHYTLPLSLSPYLDYGLNGIQNNSYPLSINVQSICRDGDKHLFIIFRRCGSWCIDVIEAKFIIHSSICSSIPNKRVPASAMVMGKSVFNVMQPFAPRWFLSEMLAAVG